MEMTDKLNVYAKNITSQNGEDGILNYILNRIESIPKVCVDIGAWDGKNLSNIYSLWHDEGWSGILIEANKKRCEQILKNYSDYNILAFNQMITNKGEGSIDILFKKCNLPPDVGILSIDIDSWDYQVWKNISYVNPRVVIIEHNHTLPGYINYHDPEGELFLRCSAKSLEELGKGKGYKLICCTLTNSIFIKNEDFNAEFFPNLPVEYLFDYSSCAAVKLSGFTSLTNSYKKLDVYFGTPSKTLKYLAYLKKVYRTLFFKYRIPSKEVLNVCKQSGIKIM